MLDFEVFNTVGKTILPRGKTIVKGYVLEYLQPYITGNVWMSVVKPKEVNDLPDPTKDYKFCLN
ncbi:MAG: hypothetical protein L6262_07270 [Weeksellaceae bacterium]|nr:hypothetical protein [Weeksellaceae bacterium]